MRGPVFRAVEHVRTGKPYRLGTVPGRGRIRVTRGADSTAGKYRGSPAHPALTAPFRSKTPQPVALVPFRRKPQSLFASAARAPGTPRSPILAKPPHSPTRHPRGVGYTKPLR